MFTGEQSARIREILISEPAWEEMTCLFALSLSDGFIPDARSLRRLVTFYGKTPSWKLEFNRSALTHGLIRFNDDETLTITNLPAELRDKLRAETEVDDDE